MAADIGHWIGLGGVAPHDTQRAHDWERRLHWVMVGVALLSIPAFLFGTPDFTPAFQPLGLALEIVILLAFSGELAWMLHVSRQRWEYLLRNWLGVLIIASAVASLAGGQTEWVLLARLLRLNVVLLALARVVLAVRPLFSPNALPYVLGLAAITMALAAAGFYFLEPTVESYGEGLWLAFTSAATVGYGDMVPTTPASRAFAVVIVLIGYAVLSIVTATIAAFFVGEDEKRLRQEMHRDIKALREEVAALRDALGHKEGRPAAQGGKGEPEKSDTVT